MLSRRTRSAQSRFWGNLVGPGVYTLIEVAVEGPRFFEAANHWAYLAYGLVIALLQSAGTWARSWNGAIQVAEDVVKASILFTMYAIFEAATGPGQGGAFFDDRSHRFVALATLLLGLSIGLAHVTGARYLRLLRETASRLQLYSEWLLGTQGVKFYDVIGDTVNTAKRIEGAAQGGEVLVSAEAISDIAHTPRLGAPRRVTVKGKEKEIEVFPLLD